MAALLTMAAASAAANSTLDELKALSLDDLAGIMVSTVAKKPQALSDSAAAVFVITNEDLLRSGAASLPDALRMVPGMQVGQINSHEWAVSARGFNGLYANKLLVQIDGRSVYSRLFSGVYWDVQQLMMADIDRIEVVRGPGGTLWGANAVNGVVNIITKPAAETQGGQVFGRIGNGEEVNLRYGWSIGEDDWMRAYAIYSERDPYFTREYDAPWKHSQVGFRADWLNADDSSVVLQGDAYDGRLLEEPLEDDPPVDFSGENLVWTWLFDTEGGAHNALRASFDRFKRRDKDNYSTVATQWDLDWQQRIPFARHEIVWGAALRRSADDSILGPGEALPGARSDWLYSAFVQGDVEVTERLRLTAGTKMEHNDYTGWELQPNVRMMLDLADNRRLWAAVSRAVRTPSRAESDILADVGRIDSDDPRNPFSQSIVTRLVGSDEFDSEQVDSYEVGFRDIVSDVLSIDVSAFYSRYDRLRTIEAQPMVCEPSGRRPPFCRPSDRIIIAGVGDNLKSGKSYGLEIATDWRVHDSSTLKFAYSYLQIEERPYPESDDLIANFSEGQNPAHQYSGRWQWDVTDNVSVDSWVRYVDELPAVSPGLVIDDYWDLDVAINWQVTTDFRLSLLGRNLAGEHVEFIDEFTAFDASRPREVERTVLARIDWKF